jgi:cell division protein FtsI/penicillin-binding protein 2
LNVASKVRVIAVCFFLVTLFTGFSWRLIHLQVAEHSNYLAKAIEKHVVCVPIYAKRGAIQDVHGEPLAQNEPMKVVVADGSLISNHEAVARLLAPALSLPEPALLQKLRATREIKGEPQRVPLRYIVLKKKVPESVVAQISRDLAAQRLKGVRFEPDTERFYPNGEMLSHVLGYVNSEGLGMDGVERTFNAYLSGRDGFRYIERDRTGRELVPYRGHERAPLDGQNVRLTIDMGLQQIVEGELNAAVKQLKPKMAIAILMRPQTGELLALANWPSYDPNRIEDSPEASRRNRAITDMVEPGSTFKIVTTAAALQQKLVSPSTMIFCESGHFNYGGQILHDHHPYAELSVEDILVKSSNIGVAKLGLQLGDQNLYEYVRRFGFGERTGLNLPGEIAGLVHPPHRWSKVSITHVPMGHEVGATPLQLVAAMSVVANGGRLMMPQIVREVADNQGNVTQGFTPVEVRRVVGREVTESIREALVQVVSKRGTAALAKVAGYKVAGKTGTAQKIGASGKYEHKYVVSFVGYMPAENPEFVGLVMVDEAQTGPNQNYGGLVAAPIFSRIGERAARYLNLTPAPEELETGTIASKGR